jgi:hypothetical protein
MGRAVGVVVRRPGVELKAGAIENYARYRDTLGLEARSAEHRIAKEKTRGLGGLGGRRHE